MTKHKPSLEQKKIIDDGGNVVVTAKPGSGKTFTIVEKINQISQKLLSYQGVIAISFTRKASNELLKRCKKKSVVMKESFFGTIDNFYLNQIIFLFSKHLTKTKVDFEVLTNIEDSEKFMRLKELKNGLTEELEELLIELLKSGNVYLEICGEIALYILDNVPECISYLKSKYTHIFIDEYQDCGISQHLVFMRLVKNGIFGIAVGDLDQAIYGFADKDSKYLASLLQEKSFKHYEINTNHRCHNSISKYSLKLFGIDQQVQVEELRVFNVLVSGSDIDVMKLIDKHIDNIKKKYSVTHNNEVGILCRNNGSAQRAKNFLKTKSKLFKENPLDKYNSYWARLFSEILIGYFTEDEFYIDIVERYIDEESSPNDFRKGIRYMSEIFKSSLDDLESSIDCFIDFAKIIYPDYPNNSAVNALRAILKDEKSLLNYKPATEDEICIMTLHKSKGLEFKIVFHLDLYKYILPREDISDEELEQSLNLHYVGITRAIDVCYLVQASQRYRRYKNDFIKTKPSPFIFIEGLDQLRRNVSWKILKE